MMTAQIHVTTSFKRMDNMRDSFQVIFSCQKGVTTAQDINLVVISFLLSVESD